LTLLAELAARLGRSPAAETCFLQALSLSPRDAYTIAAYADFLLDQDRPDDVIALLGNAGSSDNALLRLTLAEALLSQRPPTFSPHVAELRARFEASRLRGDEVHQREEARFLLHLLHRPQEALVLAQRNWSVQREPADARVLLEAAVAAKEPHAALPVLDFIRTNRLEDVRLEALTRTLELNLKENNRTAFGR
jgi:tetratricopeptide (TPR) repeat protein